MQFISLSVEGYPIALSDDYDYRREMEPRVLLIDDDPIFRMKFSKEAQRKHVPFGACSTKEEIEKLELHGGRIWVESIPDQGATFYLTIPE